MARGLMVFSGGESQSRAELDTLGVARDLFSRFLNARRDDASFFSGFIEKFLKDVVQPNIRIDY